MKGIHDCSSQSHGIGCMLRQHSFSLRLVALLSLRQGNVLGDIMLEENRCCENCAYHDDWTWVCFNGDSEMRADVANNDFVCDKWEDRSCIEKT